MRAWRIASSVALLLGFLGCASAVGPEQDRVPAAAPEDRTPPLDVRDALLPPLELPRPEAAEDPRFDVAVYDADAREFFMNLVEGTPYDVVVHPGVSGRISLSLRDVTVPEILDAVRDVYGYGFRKNARGYYVLPAAIQARVFHVNYLDISRGGLSQTRVSGGQLAEQYGSDTSQTSMGLGPTTTGGSRNVNVVESSQVTTESAMELWVELETSLRAIVGDAEGRSVVVLPQASIIVVRAMPDELGEVDDFLRQTQGNLDRQVVLEATILEVDLSDGFRGGINWAALIEWGSKSILLGQTGGGSFFENGFSEIAGNLGNLDPDNTSLPSGTDTSAFGGVFSAALDLNNFTAFIELLETQGDVHVLSSPVISTVNNQKAVIKVGTDEFFVTDISTTTVTGTVATTSPDVTLTPFFSGIALDVLPQIAPDGSVTLHVRPSISEVTDQNKTITLGDDELILPLAFSTIRETDTIVRARSGQVVVIGGLMQETGAELEASTPFVNRIPGIGKLFGQHQTASRKSELVILMRPRVVGEDGWEEELSRVRSRLEDPAIEGRVRRLLGNEGWSWLP
jgi:MSHA biogenesis protein MshL